ncbi:MAG: hypothetical protein IJE08_04775 [Clostridia bacterium]|nr:hypothetical protein [Clostridia bacterium]
MDGIALSAGAEKKTGRLLKIRFFRTPYGLIRFISGAEGRMSQAAPLAEKMQKKNGLDESKPFQT